MYGCPDTKLEGPGWVWWTNSRPYLAQLCVLCTQTKVTSLPHARKEVCLLICATKCSCLRCTRHAPKKRPLLDCISSAVLMKRTRRAERKGYVCNEMILGSVAFIRTQVQCTPGRPASPAAGSAAGLARCPVWCPGPITRCIVASVAFSRVTAPLSGLGVLVLWRVRGLFRALLGGRAPACGWPGPEYRGPAPRLRRACPCRRAAT